MALQEPKSMDECDYFSRRILDDSEGGHRLVIWVPKGSKFMNIKYKCGKCGYEGELTAEYALPFSFKCANCGAKITIKPLKGRARGAKRKRKK